MMSMQNPVRQQAGQPLFSRESVNQAHPRGLHVGLSRNDLLERSVIPSQQHGSIHDLQIRASEVQDGTYMVQVDEDLLLQMAHQEYKAGNHKLALEHCSRVHERNSKRTDALLLLGAIYYQLHDFDMCILKNEEAIMIDPHFAECYGNMANALKEKGNIDLAIQYYLMAIELRPNFCDAWSNLASAYMRKGRLNDAAECCRRALAINPRLVDAHSNLGNLLKAQGLIHHAYMCYMEALQMQPTFAIAWSNLAGLFMEQEDYQKALSYYKEAIRLKPNFADAHLNQGNVLKAMGRPQDAIQCYDRAIRLRPDYAIAYGARLGNIFWNFRACIIQAVVLPVLCWLNESSCGSGTLDV